MKKLYSKSMWICPLCCELPCLMTGQCVWRIFGWFSWRPSPLYLHTVHWLPGRDYSHTFPIAVWLRMWCDLKCYGRYLYTYDVNGLHAFVLLNTDTFFIIYCTLKCSLSLIVFVSLSARLILKSNLLYCTSCKIVVSTRWKKYCKYTLILLL